MRVGLRWREAPCGQAHLTMDSPDQNVKDSIIEETMATQVLERVSRWILERTRRM
jgi:hypothetical protein